MGAESSKAKLTQQLKETGFENPLVLMKKGKASMDDVLFTEYLHWLAAELARKGYTGQHILMVNNHDSHERARPIQAAMLNNIVIFTFPSHCTHLVQMLDVCFFGSLKASFKSECKTWLDEQGHDGNRTFPNSYFSGCFIKHGLLLVNRRPSKMAGHGWNYQAVPRQGWS